jgi:membrane protein YdbS with pleckstrin-like domain
MKLPTQTVDKMAKSLLRMFIGTLMIVAFFSAVVFGLVLDITGLELILSSVAFGIVSSFFVTVIYFLATVSMTGLLHLEESEYL